MNQLSLVGLIVASAFGVTLAEDQCTKKIGNKSDSSKDKACYIIQSAHSVEFWVHLKCSSIMKVMEVVSCACKSGVPAQQKLQLRSGYTWSDMKCGDITSATAMELGGLASLQPSKKDFGCRMNEGIKELTTAVGVKLPEEQCAKQLGAECDSTKDQPCYITQSLFNVEFWVHLKCKGISVKPANKGARVMEVVSCACKSAPAQQQLQLVEVSKKTDMECGDIASATKVKVGDLAHLLPSGKFIGCRLTEGIKENTK